MEKNELMLSIDPTEFSDRIDITALMLKRAIIALHATAATIAFLE